jgi:hypothetical protein
MEYKDQEGKKGNRCRCVGSSRRELIKVKSVFRLDAVNRWS